MNARDMLRRVSPAWRRMLARRGAVVGAVIVVVLVAVIFFLEFFKIPPFR